MNYYHTDYPDGHDYPTTDLERHRRISAARKQHRCSCCPDPILVGHPYTRTVYVQDGQFHTWRCHPLCPRDQEEQNHGAFL